MNHRRFRIALCVTDLDPGGAERCLVQLAIGLDRAEWEPRVFCLGPPGELVATLEAAGIPVTCYGARGWRQAGCVLRLSRDLRDWRPDLVQSFLFHANIAARFAARRGGVSPVVCGIRVADREHAWHLTWDRRTQRLVTHSVCVSEAVREFSIRVARLPAGKLSVIPNGVDVDRFRNALPADLTPWGIPAGSRVVLAVGRLHEQKGHRLLVEAAEPLLEELPDLHVLIVGEGPLRGDLTALLSERNLAQRVHLPGWQDDVPGLLRASTVLALPSRWEGMPNVVLEAMAAGLPVIASDVEGVGELIVDGRTGMLFLPGSVEQLREKLRSFLNDSVARKSASCESQRICAKYFGIIGMVDRYARLYRELLAKSQSVNT